jgi:hypothetical protein
LEGFPRFDLLPALPPVRAGMCKDILLHGLGFTLLRAFLGFIFEF